MITIFENYNNPDLRRIDDNVICIKNYHKKSTNEVINFKKGVYYKVSGYYGDTEAAINKYVLNYLPIECIHKVLMFDDNENLQEFNVNYNRFPIFLEYFNVPEFTNDTKNFNL